MKADMKLEWAIELTRESKYSWPAPLRASKAIANDACIQENTQRKHVYDRMC